MTLHFTNEKPIYSQIVDAIKIDILTSRYKAGEKLPSVRELADVYKVNPNTMQRAFMQLEEEKLVYTERTNGRFVSEDTKLITQIKEQMAMEKVHEFIRYMEGIGCDEEAMIAYIRKCRKDEK